jgi:hypothetical protein
MIGGRKDPRAGGIGVNANEVEDLPISTLLSPLTTSFLFESVGARYRPEAEAADGRSSNARPSLDLSSLDAMKAKRVCHSMRKPREASLSKSARPGDVANR